MQRTTQAIVLREVTYKESDRILTILTRDEGKMTVTARGGRKKGGGISAASQLLCWSEMTMSEYRGRWTLTEASTNMEFRGVREDLDKLALASYFAELTECLTEENVPAGDVLSLLLNSLYALNNLKKPLPLVKAAFELRMMCLTGYAPFLEGCAVCGSTQPEDARFHLREGILHCRKCEVEEGISMPVNPACLAAMRHIVFCEPKKLLSFRLDEASLKQLGDVCEAFLLTQLERGFHTLDFYKQIHNVSQVNPTSNP